ncbi:hypothetical protein A3Q56_06347 [Intoshia linei]|uniref:Uncharacterized protein n=1 Tax=Intoshia linei TaxID=1819745 RepID=A0A177AVC6_9BILA|nr:hypothetical protein A3Q56_06347 [Intoshia linei]
MEYNKLSNKTTNIPNYVPDFKSVINQIFFAIKELEQESTKSNEAALRIKISKFYSLCSEFEKDLMFISNQVHNNALVNTMCDNIYKNTENPTVDFLTRQSECHIMFIKMVRSVISKFCYTIGTISTTCINSDLDKI